MGYYSGWSSRKEMEEHLTRPFRCVKDFFKAGHPRHGEEWTGSICTRPREDATKVGPATGPLPMFGPMAYFDELESKEVGSVVTIAKFWSGLNLWVVREAQYDDWYCIASGKEKGGREIVVFKINRFRPSRHAEVEWGYKPVGESAGPCEVTCPLKFLDMVPDPGGYATEWREKVRAYWASRKMSRKAEVGDVYRMEGLGAGVTHLEITRLKPTMQARANTGALYRVSRPLLARRGTYVGNGPQMREKQIALPL